MSFIVNVNGKPQIFAHYLNLGTVGRTYGFGFDADKIDVTAFSDSARRSIVGNHSVSLRYDGLFDSSNYAAMNSLTTTNRLYSVWPDGAYSSATGAALSSGFATPYRHGGAVGEAVAVGFDVASDAQFDVVYAYDTLVATSTSGQYTSPSIDRGAATTAGGIFFVHVLTASASGGNTRWTLRWQDNSTDDAPSYAAVSGVGVYQANNGAQTSVVNVATGAVQRWHRFRASLDASSGNIIFLAGFSQR